MRDLHKYDTWSNLEELIPSKARESIELEFKGEPYAHEGKPLPKREEDKAELRRDIVSLSNAGGGHLLIGVAEDPAHGWAIRLQPFPRAQYHEKFVREVLSSSIEPAFDTGSLAITTVFSAADDRLQFVTRVDRSKRNMRYVQLHAAFANKDTEIIDAVAIVEIAKIRYRLRELRENGSQQARSLLRSLEVYVESYEFGPRTHRAVVYAAGEALDHPRAGRLPPDVLRDASRVIEAALPTGHLLAGSPRPYTEVDLDMFNATAGFAWALVYDGGRLLKSLEVISVGGHLLWLLLRIAHLNSLVELKSVVLGYFAGAIDYAKKAGISDAVMILDYQQRDGLKEQTEAPPKGLSWAIAGTSPSSELEDE